MIAQLVSRPLFPILSSPELHGTSSVFSESYGSKTLSNSVEFDAGVERVDARKLVI